MIYQTVETIIQINKVNKNATLHPHGLSLSSPILVVNDATIIGPRIPAIALTVLPIEFIDDE